ncbi:MAG: hypothetical protein ACLTDR_00900 [Adlercreutzia equolifaciens]
MEYPVTVAGISLGTALTFGRLAGMNGRRRRHRGNDPGLAQPPPLPTRRLP